MTTEEPPNAVQQIAALETDEHRKQKLAWEQAARDAVDAGEQMCAEHVKLAAESKQRTGKRRLEKAKAKA